MISSINIEEEIYRAENGITDVIVSENVKNQVSAYTTSNDGNKKKAEVKATIKNLGSVTKNGEIGTMYSLTAVTNGTQKTDSGEKTLHTVKAYANVIWIDYFGTENKLVSVNGGWNPSSWTLDERTVTYGVMDDADSPQECDVIDENSFNYNATNSMVGLNIGVYTWATIIEYGEIISLYVHSSFFS